MKENLSEKKENRLCHKELCIKERRALFIDGIMNIEGFDNTYVVLEISDGKITVEGENLKIRELSKEEGKIEIEGNVTGVFYSEKSSFKSGFFRRRK